MDHCHGQILDLSPRFCSALRLAVAASLMAHADIDKSTVEAGRIHIKRYGRCAACFGCADRPDRQADRVAVKPDGRWRVRGRCRSVRQHPFDHTVQWTVSLHTFKEQLMTNGRQPLPYVDDIETIPVDEADDILLLASPFFHGQRRRCWI